MIDLSMLEKAFQSSHEDGVNAVAEEYNTLCAQIDEAKTQEKSFADYRKGKEADKEALEEYILSKVTESAKTAEHSITLKQSAGKVGIVDESLIPETFTETVTSVKVDKKGILEALKNGEEVAGCELVKETSLKIK